MTTCQSEQSSVAYHDELTKAVLEIERLNKQCRDLDAKLFKTVAECRTLIDAAQVELKEQLRLNSLVVEREYVLLGKVAQLEQARDAALADAKQRGAGKTQKDAVIATDTSAMKKDQVPTELIRKLKVMYGLPPYNDPGNSARGDAYFFASIESEYSADTIEAAMTQVIRPMLQEAAKLAMKGSAE